MLSLTHSLKEFEIILKAVFIVIATQYDEDNSYCKESRDWLLDRIKKYDFSYISEIYKSNSECNISCTDEINNIAFCNSNSKSEKVKDDNIREYIEELKSIKCTESHNNSTNFNLTRNAYYFPEIMSNLTVSNSKATRIGQPSANES